MGEWSILNPLCQHFLFNEIMRSEDIYKSGNDIRFTWELNAFYKSENFENLRNWSLSSLNTFDDSSITTLLSARFLVTRVLAPRKHSFPMFTPCPTVELTAKKQLLPTFTTPEIFVQDVSQQLFPIVV